MEEQCHISTSWSRQCQTDDAGIMRCETLQQKWRHCPGKAPELVQEERSQEEGDKKSIGSSSSPFGALRAPAPPPGHPAPGFGHADPFGGPPGSSDDPFAMMHQMEQRMQMLMGGLFGGSLFGPPPPGQQQPPPSRQVPPAAQQPQQPPRPPMRVHEM